MTILAILDLDLGPALRTALIQEPEIVSRLPEWMGEPNVHTIRPIPDDAPSRVIVVNPDAAVGDEDGLTSDRPVIMRDIAIYGLNNREEYRAVEELGWLVREMFHRKKNSVRPEGYSVIDVVAAGPFPAPTDDEKEVGRMVTLTIRLRRNA